MTQRTRRSVLKVSGALLGGIAVGSTVTAAEASDRFLVETKGTGLPQGVEVVHEMPGVDFAVVRGSASDLKRSRAIKNFEPDVEIELDDPDVNDAAPTVEESSVVDEPGFGLQWDKQDLNVAEAHETTKGEGARISIIDSGVAGGHPDLNVNETLSANFTGDGLGAANAAGGTHGTHVAGIAAAADNEAGVVGTAPGAELVDCRVFSPTGGASFGSILASVAYSAAIGADVANLSLGAYPIPRQGLGSFYGKALNRVMTYANSQGTLLVLSAGNDAADLQHDKNFISLPNEGAQGMSIAATGPAGFLWDASEYGGEEPPESPALYTNYGTNEIDLAAPGGDYDIAAYLEYYDDDDGDGEPDPGGPEDPPWFYDLVFNTFAIPDYETDADGNVTGINGYEYTYGWLAGTSMSAPNVAGAAALVKSANPSYNANQVESALKRAADVPEDYGKEYYGAGYLNVVDAL